MSKVLEKSYYESQFRMYGIIVASLIMVIVLPFIVFYGVASYQYSHQHQQDNQMNNTDNPYIHVTTNPIPTPSKSAYNIGVMTSNITSTTVPGLVNPKPTVLFTVTPTVKPSPSITISSNPVSYSKHVQITDVSINASKLYVHNRDSGTINGNTIKMNLDIINPNNYSITDSFFSIAIDDNGDVHRYRYDVPGTLLANSNSSIELYYTVPDSVPVGFYTVNCGLYYMSPLDKTSIIYGCGILIQVNIY